MDGKADGGRFWFGMGRVVHQRVDVVGQDRRQLCYVLNRKVVQVLSGNVHVQ